LSFA
jgi:hypothetical protein